jgi:ferredoxin
VGPHLSRHVTIRQARRHPSPLLIATKLATHQLTISPIYMDLQCYDTRLDKEAPLNPSTITASRSRKLRELANLMNTRHKNPFPVTDALLSCFDVALTEEEVDFLLEMGTEPYTYEQAALKSGLPESLFPAFFESLGKKGLTWPQESKDDRKLFAIPGIMLGWFEVYLSGGEETPERREFSHRLDALLRSFGEYNTFALRPILNSRMRSSSPHQSILAPRSSPARGKGLTIPVGKSIDSEPAKVYPSRTIEELIDKHADNRGIAVVHCFCRQYHKMIEEPCRFQHPPESCMAIGTLARYAVEHGVGRYLNKSEAISLIQELQLKGAVHQVFHQEEDVNNPEIAICNCCWDCCGVFGSYNRGLLPLNLHSYFEAQLQDSSLCSGCETCVGFCPVAAITMVNDRCSIDSQKCIGCGQCEIHCPEEAIQLLANERKVFLPLKKKSEARIQ